MEVPGKTKDVEGTAKKQGTVCGPCQGDGITKHADGFCKDCGEYMCNSCFRQHLRVKSCRHHVMVDADMSSLPFSGREESVVKCAKHNGETVRFYCRKHEAVGCGDCMVFGHNACKSEYINNVSKNFQHSEEYKMLMSRVEKLASENKENDDKVHEKQRGYKMTLDAVLGDIRKFRLDINRYLDRVEADVISEAKHIMSENDKVLAKLGQDCKLLSSKIDKIKQMLNAKVFKENDLFINTVECKPNVSDIENAIAEVQSKKTKLVKFVCDEQLQIIVNSTRKLGTVDISTTTLRRQTTQPTENKSEKSWNDSRITVQKEEKSESKVVVGSRVQTNGKYRDEWGYGVQITGTVTAVHPDGSVSVRWDFGDTSGPHTVGTGYGEVRLI